MPALEFSIGAYKVDSSTYPAWCSLVLQVLSLIVNAIFIRKVEKTASTVNLQTKETSEKFLYVSVGVVLLMALFFFGGILLSVIIFSLPLVMVDEYQWTTLEYAPVWIGISVMGIIGVQLAKYSGRWLKSHHYAIVVPTLLYLCLMCVLVVISTFHQKFPPGLGETLFLFGTETSFLAYQLLQTVLSSVFTQVVPMEFIVSSLIGLSFSVIHQMVQVRMMPLTSAAGSIGKILGPFVSDLLVHIAGMKLVYTCLLGLSSSLALLCVILHRHLKSLEDEEEAQEFIPFHSDWKARERTESFSSLSSDLI